MIRKLAFATITFCPILFVPLAHSADRAASAADTDGISVLIVGPESVQPGTLVKLDASRSDAESFVWRLAGGSRELYDVTGDGKVVYFASPTPGRYVFLLAVAKNTEPGKPPALTIAEHTLIVQGTTPVPPGPQPIPPTPEPLPAGRFGLAAFTRDTIVRHVANLDLRLAEEFAGNFKLVASQIAAGVLKTPAAANAKLKERNQETARKGPAWDAVSAALRQQLNALASAKKLDPANLQDLQAVYDEIGTGYAAAAK